MTRALRAIDTGLRPARWNVAMTAALAALHRAGEIPDTIRLHRYQRSVLIGRSQDLDQAVDRARCRADGVECARRVTGGGAVYMAPGALAWDLVVDRRRLAAMPLAANEAAGAAIAGGLACLGLEARFRAPNAIEVDGRKICGMSAYLDGASLVQQGTILLDTDLAEMERYLRAPPGAHGALTTLAAALGRAPSPATVGAAIAEALAALLSCRLVAEMPRAAELSLADDIHAGEVGRDSFVAGEDVVVADRTPGRATASAPPP